MATASQHIDLFAGSLSLAVTDVGKGERHYLLLHGGAGPMSMSGLSTSLSSRGARVVVPTHPGFAGEPRPERFSRVEDLVLTYLALIEKLGVSNLVVVGSSFGAWLALELALRCSPAIAAVVALNGVGIDTEGTDLNILDLTALPPPERAAYAFHNPAKFAVLPTGPQAAAIMAANQASLRVYAGPTMNDPTLRARLSGIKVPTLVVWGLSDRIVTEGYGRRLAESIPGARMELVKEAGHFPQIEKLDEVTNLIETVNTA